MPRTCQICVHPQRVAIEAASVVTTNLRELASSYAVSYDALWRHHKSHSAGAIGRISEAAAVYQEVRERASALNIAAELGVILERARLLHDACDTWLRDPNDRTVYYVGPRSNEVTVVHEWMDAEGGVHRERESLLTLLQRVEAGLAVTVVRAETKHADIRELVLKAQDGSIKAIETVAGLMERAWKLQSEMDEAAKIRAMSEDEVRAGLREMLQGDCGLSEKATEAFLSKIEAGAREAAVEEMARTLEGKVE